MTTRLEISDDDFAAAMAAQPKNDLLLEGKYCDLLSAMQDENIEDDEIFRLATRYCMPLSLYHPPKFYLFPGIVGFELLVNLVIDVMKNIAKRSDLSPDQRQTLELFKKDLVGLPESRPATESSFSLTYRPQPKNQGMLKHYFACELSPSELHLYAGEFDEMNDHNSTYSFELDADGRFEESGLLGAWLECIGIAEDLSYKVLVSAVLPVSSRPTATTAAPEPKDEDRPSPPPPPVLTWEEIEQGKAGQLDFPALVTAPSMAERAFLSLSREWLAEYQGQTPPKCLTSHMGDLALACLLLAVEWGKDFTRVAHAQMEENRITAAGHAKPSWMNELPWQLCQSVGLKAAPKDTKAVANLTVNLDHHNSSIRYWMMEIGWFTVPWLDRVEATLRLFKNLADTLCGPFMAAGLASRFFDKEEEFFNIAKKFKPPKGFEDQYQDRLKHVEKHGILTMQTIFWQDEAICRREIELAVLSWRVRKMAKQKT